MSHFAANLEVLPAPQRRLWPELASVPRSFVLYGGTALALRLGHRASVDFDFFSPDAVNHPELSRLPFMDGAQVLQEEREALTVSLDRQGPVKLSFFGPIGFGRVGEPQATSSVLVASLIDLAATKIKVLLQRIEAKDYLDIAALLRAEVSLSSMLRAARTLYGKAFNPLIAQKTLGFFEGGDLSSLDLPTRELLMRASLEDVDLPPMAKISDRLD
jgi:hypothetical protein